MKRVRKVLMVAAPLVAIATLMVGLRVGAGDAVRAAVVFGAPPARPAPDGRVPLSWSVLTFVDDRGVRETVPVRGLSAVARARGQEARWRGESNADGVAEARFTFDVLAPGDELHLEVRAEGDPAPLAAGPATWKDVLWATSDAAPEAGTAAVRPSKRAGPIGLDVVVEGERLVVGFPTTLWVRVTPPPGVAASAIELELAPEPGLVAERERARPCDGSGWAEVPVTAQAHVVGLAVRARGPEGLAGEWFGALPVAPGAFFVGLPRVVEAGRGVEAVIVAPNPRTVAYAEVDDERGRAAASALALAAEPGDPTPRARFAFGPLAPGLHWLVVSGEPRGAERLAGAAIARPFLVGGAPEGSGVDATKACSVGPWLARRAPAGFPRWVALDGLPARSAHNRERRRLGLFVALVALAAAATLELLLLTAASREARAVMQLAELEAEGVEKPEVTAKPPGGSLAVALLVALLGFALLAALLLAKA